MSRAPELQARTLPSISRSVAAPGKFAMKSWRRLSRSTFAMVHAALLWLWIDLALTYEDGCDVVAEAGSPTRQSLEQFVGGLVFLKKRPLDPVAVEELFERLLATQVDGFGIALDEFAAEQFGAAV